MSETADRRTSAKFLRKQVELMEAAVEILNRDGVRGMTLAAVATKVGLLPSGISYYFRKKEDLAAACFGRTIDILADMVARSAQAPDSRSRVAAFWQNYVELRRQVAVGQRPEIALLDHARGLGEPWRSMIGQRSGSLLQQVEDVLVAEPGGMEGLSPARTARAFVLLAQAFWATAWLYRYDPQDMPRAGRWADNILAGGLPADDRPIHVPQPLDLAGLEEPQDGAGQDAFLKAATAVINECGYHGASVDKIAARADASKGAFYYRHDAKDDVAAGCFRRTLNIFRRSQDAACAAHADGWTRLCVATEALIRFDTSPSGPLLRMSVISALPLDLRTTLVIEWLRVADRFAAIITDGQVDGSIRPLDASIAAEMLLGAIHSSPDLRATLPGLSPEDTFAACAATVLRGLFARPVETGPGAIAPSPAAGR